MSAEKKREPTAVGKRIKDLREARGMTQHDLSVASNVDKVTIWRIETGVTQRLSLGKVEALARGMRVPVNEILNAEHLHEEPDPLAAAFVRFRREVEIFPERQRPGAIRYAEIFLRSMRVEIREEGEKYDANLLEGNPPKEEDQELERG